MPAMPTGRRDRRKDAVLLGISLAAGIVAAFFPILRAVDYPLSLVGGPLLTLLMGVRGVLDGKGTEVWRTAVRRTALTAAAVALFALPAALASAFQDAVCEPLYGALFLVAGPFGSGVAAWAAGRLLGRWLRPAIALPLVPLLLLGSAAVAAAEFAFTPMVRFYGTFFGLYHGAIYDEAVFVEAPYLWLRAWNLAGVLAVLWLLDHFSPGGRSALRTRPWLHRSGGIAAALAFVALTVLAPRLGIVATTGRLEGALDGKVAGDRIVVRFASGGRAAGLAPLVLADLEFRAGQIRRFYGLPEGDGIVTAWLYESPRHKAKWMGAGRTSIAKPWLGQLHVHTREVGGRLLAHELAHVLLAEAARSWLGMPVSDGLMPRPGILEGAAVAVERGEGVLTTHEWTRAMRDAEMLPDMALILEKPAFWRQASSRAYTACGSFVRFLVEQEGPRPFLEVYGGDSFERAYGRPVDALLDEWNGFLDGVPLAPDDVELARYVFARAPVFDRLCPYAGGRCIERVRRHVGQGEGSAAAPIAARGVRTTHGDLATGQQLVRLLYAGGQTASGLALIELLARRNPEPGAVAENSLLLAESDGYWLLGEAEAAGEGFAALARSPFERWTRPAVELRRALARQPAHPAVLRLACGAVTTREVPGVLAELEGLEERLSPAERWVVGTVMARLPERSESAGRWLEQSVAELEDEPLRQAGVATLLRLSAFRRDLPAARTHLESLRQLAATRAEIEEATDWSERIDWLEKAETALR
jgi:hypothetical protein